MVESRGSWRLLGGIAVLVLVGAVVGVWFAFFSQPGPASSELAPAPVATDEMLVDKLHPIAGTRLASQALRVVQGLSGPRTMVRARVPRAASSDDQRARDQLPGFGA